MSRLMLWQFFSGIFDVLAMDMSDFHLDVILYCIAFYGLELYGTLKYGISYCETHLVIEMKRVI